MNTPNLNQYNHINPIRMQKYERYLPNAFDESLTILEKMNNIIGNMNEIAELTNDVVDTWNNVMVWIVNEGLTDVVNQRLNRMIEDGTLDDIINENIFNDLNNIINTVAQNLQDFKTEHENEKLNLGSTIIRRS